MKKSVFFGLFVAGVMTFGSCGGNKQQAAADDEDTTAQEELVPRDLTVYGICTSSSGMSTLEMLTDSGDTLKLNLEKAEEDGKVFGGFQPSDRLAVVTDKSQKNALIVINLNTLMGDWVMPDPIDGSAEIGIRIKEGGIARASTRAPSSIVHGASSTATWISCWCVKAVATNRRRTATRS